MRHLQIVDIPRKVHYAPGLLSDAVLHTYEKIEKQVMDIVLNKQVQTITGETISLQADTICFHGDGYGVAIHATMITQALKRQTCNVSCAW